MNPWLTFSLILLGIWTLIWIVKPSVRKEMLWVSIVTAPLGLTEPMFVPEYWNPPSLFDLAARTGFDIESLIFCFAVGGIGAVLYETFGNAEHVKMGGYEMHASRHKFHKVMLMSPIIVFLPLYFFTGLNPIYTSSIAMLIGSLAAMLCRPALIKKICLGSLLFLGVYFIFFFSFNLVYPGIVEQVWNLNAISGILILGVPLEELMFAVTFGGLWSSYYEHITWSKVIERKEG